MAETKGNKASGEDFTKIEHLKHLNEATIHKVTYLFYDIYQTGILPCEWLTTTFVLISKKSEVTKCGDHRTMSLMSQAAKMYANHLQEDSQ